MPPAVYFVIVAASQALFGISIRIIPPPTRPVSPVGGNTDPQAWAVPVMVLPETANTFLVQRCTWPEPARVAVPACQVTSSTECDASVNCVRAAHAPFDPPVP